MLWWWWKGWLTGSQQILLKGDNVSLIQSYSG